MGPERAVLTCPRCFPSPPALLREEVAQLQEEVHLLRQMKEMLSKDLEETHGTKSPEVLSATELKVQLAQKEQELARAKEALQGKGCPNGAFSRCFGTPEHHRELVNEGRRRHPSYLGEVVQGGVLDTRGAP